MVGVRIFHLQEVELLLIMAQGCPLKDANPTGIIHPVILATQSSLEVLLVLLLGEVMWMMAIAKDLRGLLLHLLPILAIVKYAPVIMMLCLGQNVLMLLWLVL